MDEVTLQLPALHADITTDVCVIGAGISGLTTALFLAQSGKQVVVVDDGPAGGGETGRTSAHLSNALDDHYFAIERLHGTRGILMAAESHTRAIDMIEQIVRKESIDCDFARVDGYLFAPDERSDYLDLELEAAHRAGLTDVELVERSLFAGHDTGRYLRFPNQAQFHPLKYLNGLMKLIQAAGGHIYLNTHAESIESGHPSMIRVANGRTITAHHVAVTTNVPINDRVFMHTKQFPYRTYLIALEIPAGAVQQALYWDTIDIYHYVRVTRGPEPGTEYLMVGGEDHKTGHPEDPDVRFRRLEEWARTHFPGVGARVNSWSGQVVEPVDYMGYIGRNPGDAENVYIVTGDSGNGLTHGTIGGMLITDLVLGRPNPWAELYDPSRKTLRAGREYTKENLGVARHYADWLTTGDVDTEEDVVSGTGAIIRSGLKKIAVYRDREGRLHRFDATCPHLGCIVEWNELEHSWDCPCHGSRFDMEGKVINGPANSGLSRLEES